MRVTIIKKIFATKLAVEKNFIVFNPLACPELNANIRMEVGFNNMIHLEYELFQSKFHLDECIMGKLYFVDVQMKVKAVEVHLIKAEYIGSGTNRKSDFNLISKFELVDGNPAANEIVPIRMFISNFENISPSYRELNNIFSVKYFLKFVVINEDDKSFYKQQEVFLWRKNIN
jgi:vacuolar protein sorting-associated protein 26